MQSSSAHSPQHGRGAAANPGNRFEQLHVELEPVEYFDEDDAPKPLRTLFYRDATQSFLTSNSSPDIPFTFSGNPYRGCEHGCIYCYARPTHEYLGFSAGLDFESRIMVKMDAPALLRTELARPKWEPQSVSLSGVSDCYQPAERHFQLTRRCLEVFLDFRNPVSIVTKNQLVTRDIDLLQELARFNAAAVFVSITTLDADLARKMEPRTSSPRARLETVRALAAAGIPVGVMTAPVIPGLTDHELPVLLKAAADAGATRAGYVMLRLPHGVKELFADWLERQYPGHKEKILERVKSLRGGKLNDAEFGSRMRGEGFWAGQIAQLFAAGCQRAGLNAEQRHRYDTSHFRVPGRTRQLDLF